MHNFTLHLKQTIDIGKKTQTIKVTTKPNKNCPTKVHMRKKYFRISKPVIAQQREPSWSERPAVSCILKLFI